MVLVDISGEDFKRYGLRCDPVCKYSTFDFGAADGWIVVFLTKDNFIFECFFILDSYWFLLIGFKNINS